MECVVYGVASRYVYEVDEILRRLRWRVAAYVDNLDGDVPPGLEPLVAASDLGERWSALGVVIPVTTPGFRRAVEADARERGFGTFPPVVDPSTTVAARSVLAEGVLVNAGSVIAAQAELGRFATVNRAASLGHGATIGEYAFVGPGATVCGEVIVEPGAFVGAGAVVSPELRIGRNATVGAGAVITTDVAPHTVVVGNPAEVVREDVAGYGGVGV